MKHVYGLELRGGGARNPRDDMILSTRHSPRADARAATLPSSTPRGVSAHLPALRTYLGAAARRLVL